MKEKRKKGTLAFFYREYFQYIKNELLGVKILVLVAFLGYLALDLSTRLDRDIYSLSIIGYWFVFMFSNKSGRMLRLLPISKRDKMNQYFYCILVRFTALMVFTYLLFLPAHFIWNTPIAVWNHTVLFRCMPLWSFMLFGILTTDYTKNANGETGIFWSTMNDVNLEFDSAVPKRKVRDKSEVRRRIFKIVLYILVVVCTMFNGIGVFTNPDSPVDRIMFVIAAVMACCGDLHSIYSVYRSIYGKMDQKGKEEAVCNS